MTHHRRAFNVIVTPEDRCGRINDRKIMNYLVRQLKKYDTTLTPREKAVLFLVLRGHAAKCIAKCSKLNVRTIYSQIGSIQDKLKLVFGRKIQAHDIFGLTVERMKKNKNYSYIDFFDSSQKQPEHLEKKVIAYYS